MWNLISADMKERLFIFVMSCICYFGFNEVIIAGSGSLKVKVIKGGGGEQQEVEGVNCALKKVSKEGFKKGKTSKNGVYLFSGLDPGRYKLFFGSTSLKGNISHWALPKSIGPFKVGKNRKRVEIQTREPLVVKGKIDYEDNFDLGQSSIKSSRSQFDVHPNSNGEFRLHGVFSKKPIKLRIHVLPRLPSNENDVPLYARVVNIRESKIIPGSVIDVGSINVPRPGEKEFVRIRILDAKEQKRLTGKRLNQLSLDLRIKSQNKKIILKGSSWLLRRKVRRGGEKGAKFRLPSGVYTVWWHGYEGETKKRFRIEGDQPPKIDMRLPDK